MTDWIFVKDRTAADGAVWRSADGELYKRTGGPDVAVEAQFQRHAFDLGYPVPNVIETGNENGLAYFVERSLGDMSLHDTAVTDARPDGGVSSTVIQTASAVAGLLLSAEAKTPAPTSQWFEKAGFTANVFEENPDLDNAEIRATVDKALDRLRDVPMCHGHLDYGLPNAFPGGVIDWQHHGPIPLGYDVYPALDIVAFKGGGKGYFVGADQRAAYLTALDNVSETVVGQALSAYLGEYLLVKCFFFLALMRPSDPARHDKYVKWQYRRALFTIGLDQYESSTSIDTGSFPTFEQFADAHGHASTSCS